MTADRGSHEELGYGIGAVSRRLGVPAPTLRTWSMRYGIGPSRRSPGGHRRYGDADVRRLEEMNRLIRAGVPAADAARHARSLVEFLPDAAPGAGDGGPTTAADADAGGPETRETPGAAGVAGAFGADGRDGVPAVGVPTADMLARAALALDGSTVSAEVAASLAAYGVRGTWERLIRPVFDTIVRRQSEGRTGVDVEHLFSERILAALHPLCAPPAEPVNERPVLITCAEDEQHSLPGFVLAATLAFDLRVSAVILGARTPYSAIGSAMRRLGPSVVFVWSQLAETGDPSHLAALPALRPPARVVAGGPGWWDGLPPRVPAATSLEQAVSIVMATL
ncbi:MerR family transcriptional regulator [Streptosporangiaceae bacterium NEAU-GS5]|nr:MerR family transcriptional regulator [Streptosporangiaceae bacterium NEAU-GS5]